MPAAARGQEGRATPSSPKGGPIDNNGTADNGSTPVSYQASPVSTNGSAKTGTKRAPRGRTVLARVHMLDGSESDCPIEVSSQHFLRECS